MALKHSESPYPRPPARRYFLLVEKYFDRAVQAERLVGLFPGNANGASGVFLMTSSDGLHFSKPELLLSSKTWGKQERTTDYPVRGARP